MPTANRYNPVGHHGYGVNDNSQVTGETALANGDNHAFVTTEKGRMIDLGTLGGNYSVGYSITEEGQVAGASTLANNDTHAFVTTKKGRMKDLDTLGSHYSIGYSINKKGDVVGRFETTDTGTTHAFLAIKGVMTDLNNLIDSSLGWVLIEARGINDKGQITGFGRIKRVLPGFPPGDYTELTHAFILTPLAMKHKEKHHP